MRALIISASLALLAGCSGVIEGSSPVLLAALDPDLLREADTLLFSFSKTQTCSDLVDRSPAEISALLEDAEENAPLQPIEPTAPEHVFGRVEPNVPTAYFVLASAKTDLGPRLAFADFTNTVFAFGCRDFAAPSGTRHDLPITLFPIGLR